MSDDDWRDSEARCLGLRLAGGAIEEVDARGHRIVDDTLLILLNAHHEPVTFVLPASRPSVRWEVVLDTRNNTGKHQLRFVPGGKLYELGARSLALFRHRDKPVQRGA
jgi:glycogen operon protein